MIVVFLRCSVLSRVDLITTAVRVLRRVHGENEKHKKMLEELLAKTANGAPPAPASASLVESERYSRTAKGLGAASGLDSRFLRGTGAAPSPSWAERQALLSNPSAYAGLVGGPSHAWASRFSQFSHLAGYQAADLFSTRAAAGLPSADRAYLSQFGGASSANRGYIESLLQQKQSTDNRAMAEALYSSFQQRPTEKSDAPGKK